VELARKHSFYIVADEVYQLLHFGIPPPLSLVEYDLKNDPKVLSLGSFSKILGPGLRLGWIRAHEPILTKFNNSGLANSAGGLAHFTSGLVLSSLDVNSTERISFQDKHIEFLKESLKDRANFMYKSLTELLPKEKVLHISKPTGGYFIWIKLAQNVDEKFDSLLEENKVRVRSGKAFSPNGNFKDCIRLSFAYYEKNQIEDGIKRLAKCLTNL